MEEDYEEMKKSVVSEMKRIFNPELLNRIDETIIFHPLGMEHILQIVEILLADMAKRLAERGLSIHVTDDAKRYIAEKGFDPLYGARHLKRALQKHLDDPLSEDILRGQFAGDCDILVDIAPEKDKLQFSINVVSDTHKSAAV
jgi:ATP-dependent Clp protease ATP-binding subunit ClpC